MYTFATGGLEGVLTAEDVTNLRTYRDGLNTTYTSMVELRKEIEEKVLKVFDEWYDKVNKNVDSISRYTDMLGQFKDVINIIGKETLGLSDAFMKNFEQKSIDQSRDNIEAAKQQYESLAEIYANAQDKLEAARADGNEDTIKHWEEIVDKT
jgi:flagellar biosynthesis chaperone FliJ